MKPYICPQCGGQINLAKLICEYCGTQFLEECNEIIVVAYNPRVHTLGANVILDREMATLSPKEAAEMAIKHMANQFAEGIAQFMEVRTIEEPKTDTIRFSARLRVLDSGYKFE